MIDHVPGPMNRLASRLYARWEQWVDSRCADRPPTPQAPAAQQPVQPAPRGVAAMIAGALGQGRTTGLSQREIARRLNTSKSSVQRAQRLVQQYAAA